jgi:opacity protein-like surface antigen
MRLKLVLAALFLAAAAHVFSQSGPAAIESRWEICPGGGFSEYHTTHGSNLMQGITGWADIYPNIGPRFLHGLGMEAEDRFIGIGSSSTSDVHINNENTGGGGLIYSVRYFSRVRPYVKYLMEFGTSNFQSSSFNPDGTPYTHDTRTLYVPGGGIEYEVVHRIWIRADYERQPWHKFLSPNTLYQQGVSIGVSYSFQHLHTRSPVREN